MNAKQEAKLNMFRATQKHCTDNTGIVSTIPAFEAACIAFSAKIASIIATTQQEELITKGITMDKAAAKKSLCELATDIAATTFAFAAASNNNQLMQEVNFTYTSLFRSKDELLAPRCQNIHNAAQNNIASLPAYGITEETLVTLQTTINNYQGKVPDPRNAAAQKATIRTNLKRLLNEADAVLKLQMDKIVGRFKAANPDFVSAYTINRVIIDPSKTTTAIKGTVKSSADQTPVAGAIITIEGTTNKAFTNRSGKYEIKPVPAGTFSIKIISVNFKDFTTAGVVIKQGQINKQHFTIEPV